MTSQSTDSRTPELLVLIGTKAQFIKTAPILRVLDARRIPYRLVYTGQHSETFNLLEVAFGTRPADDNLVPNFEAATHASFIGWCYRFWRAVFHRIREGTWKGAKIGLVHGDTASTLFSAIALRLAGIRVAHVEAGLRSPRMLEPFPEEIIRRLVSRLSVMHFAPDGLAVSNLFGVEGTVTNTGGNTLRDALAMSLQIIGDMPRVGGGGGFAIASIHRSENLASNAVFELLMQEVVETSTRLPVKFVLHPATRAKIDASKWRQKLESQPRLELVERMDYPDFVALLVGSRFLMTDGGSNQEEAAMLGLPTLLLRRTTERNDGIGDNVTVSGLKREAIREFVTANAETRWPVRALADESPSAKLIDVLEASLGKWEVGSAT